jgi:hypothetical protein
MEVRDGRTALVQYGENKLPQRLKRDEKERDRDILQAVFDNGKHLRWSFRWPAMSVCQNCCCFNLTVKKITDDKSVIAYHGFSL